MARKIENITAAAAGASPAQHAHEGVEVHATGATAGHALVADGAGAASWAEVAGGGGGGSLATHTLSTLPGHGVVVDTTVADWAAVQAYAGGNGWVECADLDGRGTYIFRFESGVRYGPYGEWIKNPRYIIGDNGEDELIIPGEDVMPVTDLVDHRPTNLPSIYGPNGTQTISESLQTSHQLWRWRRFGFCLPVYSSSANLSNGKRIKVTNKSGQDAILLGVNCHAGYYLGMSSQYDGGAWGRASIVEPYHGSVVIQMEGAPGSQQPTIDHSTHHGIAGHMLYDSAESLGDGKGFLTVTTDTAGIPKAEFMRNVSSISRGYSSNYTPGGTTTINPEASEHRFYVETAYDNGTTWAFVDQSSGWLWGEVIRFDLLIFDGGSYPQTWPPSVVWVGGEPALPASGGAVLQFTTINAGSTWYGSRIA